MADQDNKPDAEVEDHVAKKGVKDAGHVVTGALGEPLVGSIADVTDED